MSFRRFSPTAAVVSVQNWLVSEVVPPAKLIGASVAGSRVLYAFVFLGPESSVLGALFALIDDILAVKAGIVPLYAVARGVQLLGE